jgi:hypothetical protein
MKSQRILQRKRATLWCKGHQRVPTLYVILVRSASTLVARVGGRWPLKIQKNCLESKKIKKNQSINLKVMKSRANQLDLRIKDSMEKVKKWEKGQNKI